MSTVLAAGFAAALVGSMVADRGGSDAPAAGQAELEAYEEAVLPLLREGGKIVQLGLKVGIGDLGTDGQMSPSVVESQARSWRRDLGELEASLVALSPPSGLDQVHRDFTLALQRYRRVASIIVEAAGESGERRANLLDEAIRLGEAADGAYDEASTRVQELRRRFGLGPTPDLPDPVATAGVAP